MGVAPCAVIADISVSSAQRSANILMKLGYEIAHIGDDGARAVAKCIERRASLIMIDAVLPSLDGAAAAEKLRGMRLALYPSVLICAYPGLSMPLKKGLPGICVLQKPVNEDAVVASLQVTAVENRRVPGDIARYLSSVLDRLGIPAHPGRDYLADAAFLSHEDRTLLSALTGSIYPMVARRFGVSAAAVERAMRHAIETAWSSGNIDEQYAIFKDTIDAARGKPTCGGMIAQLTEMLRMEGV